MIDNISWLAIYPEIILLVMACVIALVDLGVKSARRTGTYVLTMLTALFYGEVSEHPEPASRQA